MEKMREGMKILGDEKLMVEMEWKKKEMENTWDSEKRSLDFEKKEKENEIQTILKNFEFERKEKEEEIRRLTEKSLKEDFKKKGEKKKIHGEVENTSILKAEDPCPLEKIEELTHVMQDLNLKLKEQVSKNLELQQQLDQQPKEWKREQEEMKDLVRRVVDEKEGYLSKLQELDVQLKC
eukprot:TRINITY_DN9791_c0_g1_i5.p1 TRINITY_DN9791_c0_g1~~TRINITY_DN9791_c0_g1_i5.p1  ORF type:complete len:179 (-),score=96.77 TRINITY_DN9791_c0_g1_i5:360-896(-)